MTGFDWATSYLREQRLVLAATSPYAFAAITGVTSDAFTPTRIVAGRVRAQARSRRNQASFRARRHGRPRGR